MSKEQMREEYLKGAGNEGEWKKTLGQTLTWWLD
jgi:hypothetical protein